MDILALKCVNIHRNTVYTPQIGRFFCNFFRYFWGIFLLFFFGCWLPFCCSLCHDDPTLLPECWSVDWKGQSMTDNFPLCMCVCFLSRYAFTVLAVCLGSLSSCKTNQLPIRSFLGGISWCTKTCHFFCLPLAQLPQNWLCHGEIKPSVNSSLGITLLWQNILCRPNCVVFGIFSADWNKEI